MKNLTSDFENVQVYNKPMNTDFKWQFDIVKYLLNLIESVKLIFPFDYRFRFNINFEIQYSHLLVNIIIDVLYISFYFKF